MKVGLAGGEQAHALGAGGGTHAGGGALEQPRAEVASEPREDTAESRLRHVETLGGAAESARLDDGEEPDTDRFACRLDGESLNAWLVARGWASNGMEERDRTPPGWHDIPAFM